VNLGEFLSDDVRARLRSGANQLACELAAQRHEGEVPNSFHEHVEEVAFDAMLDALHSTEVDDLEEWGADQDLEERADRDRERAVIGRDWS
jgi:hypothetical protein